jgi:hypothetical protein
MAHLEIDPRPAYEVLFEPKAVDPAGAVENASETSKPIDSSSRRFPQLLGRASPAHRLHRLDNG